MPRARLNTPYQNPKSNSPLSATICSRVFSSPLRSKSLKSKTVFPRQKCMVHVCARSKVTSCPQHDEGGGGYLMEFIKVIVVYSNTERSRLFSTSQMVTCPFLHDVKSLSFITMAIVTATQSQYFQRWRSIMETFWEKTVWSKQVSLFRKNCSTSLAFRGISSCNNRTNHHESLPTQSVLSHHSLVCHSQDV